jgi:hypothetical protein
MCFFPKLVSKLSSSIVLNRNQAHFKLKPLLFVLHDRPIVILQILLKRMVSMMHHYNSTRLSYCNRRGMILILAAEIHNNPLYLALNRMLPNNYIYVPAPARGEDLAVHTSKKQNLCVH